MKGNDMNWADMPKKTADGTPKATHETAAIVLDTLTCAFIYIEAVKQYHRAVEAIPDAEDENYAKARALAWERACSTSIDMLNKSFEGLNESDTTVAKIIGSRWNQAENVIVASIAVIALMQEDEQQEEAGNE